MVQYFIIFGTNTSNHLPKSTAMKKICAYLGWASGLFGGLLMLAGVIGFFVNGEFLGVKYFQNWFWLANSFIFFGIFLLVATRDFCTCGTKHS